MRIAKYRVAWLMYCAAASVIDATGLRRSRATRRLVDRMSMIARRHVMRFLAPNVEEPIVVGGHWMILTEEASASFSLRMLVGRYRVGSTRYLERRLRPGMSVIEAGAHHGYVTLAAASLVGPRGRVFCFEPDPRNYVVLVKNIELNGYKNVRALDLGVGAGPGTATLHRSNVYSGMSSLYRDMWAKGESLPVEMTSIDDFLEGAGWPTIDLVLMDVLGAESTAIAGMARLIERARSLELVVKLMPDKLELAGVRPESLLDEMGRLGFAVYGILESGEVEAAKPAQLHALCSAGDPLNLCFRRET